MGTGSFNSSGLALLVALCGCTFDSSNQASLDDGGLVGDDGGPVFDASDRPDAIAPEDCPEPIHVVLSINGRTSPLPNDSNSDYAKPLIGDTIELSAVGTCTQAGPINLQWRIDPGSEINSTALPPSRTTETLTVYSRLPGSSVVYLDVDDGSSVKRSSAGFTVFGFQNLATVPGAEVRDLSAGQDFLWVAAKDGAYRGDLNDITASPYPEINEVYDGDDIPNNMKSVHESSSGARVWFGSDSATEEAYRLVLPAGGGIDTFALVDNKTKVKDISDAPGGAYLATDKDVLRIPDTEDTAVLERTEAANGVSFGATGAWAGKAKLHAIGSTVDFDVFGPGMNKILSLTESLTPPTTLRLWVGADALGVARVAVAAGVATVEQVYTSEITNGALIGNKARALTSEASGDVWVATDEGVSRFKQDRQIWVPMGNTSGLGSRLDLRAVTVDEKGGRRVIFVGGRDGLSLMRAPAQ